MPRTCLHRSVAVSAVAAALLVIPVAASAHPALNPNELPPGEAVESTLVVPHGCAPGGGMPGDGEAEPTTELAVQQTEGVTLEPGAVDGWQVTDDGEAWVWSDDGGATTDVIEFPVTITIEDAAAGDEIYLRAFQECADGSSFQWVGTPDAEAQFPAVLLATSEGEVGTAEPADDMDMDHGDMDMDEDGEGMDMDEDGEDSMDEEMDMDEGEDDMAADEESSEDDMALDGEEAASEDGGLSTPLIVLIAVVLLAGAAALALRARRS